jgi:hypothetical protein
MFDLWDAEGLSRSRLIYLSIDSARLSRAYLSIGSLTILGRKGPLSKSARDMLAYFAEVMKPALERYFLGRFRLGRGSVHAVSEHAELQRDDLIPITRAAAVLGCIDSGGLGQPTAGAGELTHVLFRICCFATDRAASWS